MLNFVFDNSLYLELSTGMEPPLQSPEALIAPSSRVDACLKPVTSTPPFLAPGGVKSEEFCNKIISQNVLEPTADDVLGQFSYAPATQTTIVTTTTTTTTNFPPLIMKAPNSLHELDPKMYPLAFTPTPQSIKRFCFDVGGRQAIFSEADDTRDALNEVRKSKEIMDSRIDFADRIFLHYSLSSSRKHCENPMVPYSLF